MNVFLQSIKKFRVLWIFVILVVFLSFLADYTRKNREDIIYPEALDLVVATVEQEEITLREFALYVVHQETEVQKMAEIYDPEPTETIIADDIFYIRGVTFDMIMLICCYTKAFKAFLESNNRRLGIILG